MRSQDFRPEVMHAFGLPIVAVDIPDCEAINRELAEIILQRRETDKGLIRSNINSWHSDEDFVTWGGRPAQFIAQTLASICSNLTEFPPETGAGSRQWVVRMWANVSERGALNRVHSHPGAFWSGVYYVNDGRRTKGDDVGADLVLHSPHELVSSMYAPDVHIRLPNGPRLSSTMAVKPRPGLGVIFPSWLLHEVDPFRGDGVRISVALNFSLTSGRNPSPS